MSEQNIFNKEKTNQFIDACCDKDLKTVKLLINDPEVNVNETYLDGKTAFHIVCAKDYFSIAQRFSKNDRVDLNARDNYGKTPFFVACERGYYDLVENLLRNNNINKNILNDEDISPLDIACINKHLNVIELLIKDKIKKQDPKLKEELKNCLYIAKTINRYDIVELILKYTPKFDNPNFEYFCNAATNGNYELVKDMMKTNDFSYDLCNFKVNNNTLLILLIYRKYDIIAEYIIKNVNPNILSTILNVKDKDGKPLIMLAIKYSPIEFIEFLINLKELDLNAEDNKGRNILHEAARVDDRDITKLLLKKVYPNANFSNDSVNDMFNFKTSRSRSK